MHRTRSEAREPSTESFTSYSLSTREIEIVRLIITGMTDQEIAVHFFIALSTVKRHATHIYTKLGVERRSQGITRVQELGL